LLANNEPGATMKLYLPEIRLRFDEPADLLPTRVAEALHTAPASLQHLEIRRKSLDTRQRDVLWQVYGVEVEVDPAGLDPREVAFYSKLPKRALPAPLPPRPTQKFTKPILIVGAGPAGLFCALRLTHAGVPVTLIERGKPIRRRAQDTKVFRKGGPLNPESNIQFGEGGAGTYSDGKLTYRTDDPLSAYVLEEFVKYGAKPDIRYLSRPHIGTEHLRASIVRMSAALAQAGVEFRFDARVDSLVVGEGASRQARGVRLAGGEELLGEAVILAVGHSARDTFATLLTQGVPFIPKPFSVGVRAEHPQMLIDGGQYGRHAGVEGLPAASYALSQKVQAGGAERGVYSFCMCPGGEVMACSSELGGVVTNGMSYSVQRSGFANSGIVVTVEPSDFGGSDRDPFAGVRFQRELEEKAFAVAGGNYYAPAQRITDFLRKKTSGTIGAGDTTYRPGVVEADLNAVLPPFVAASLAKALPAFERKIRGYSSDQGIIVGFETRTSSPVRIPRGETLEAVGWQGLYPLGEGAGYAGGIVSAAVDGVRAADAILARFA
jgi:uncharacterized FAD-dependent dehydrogenase